jgi:mevalonate kinase
MHWQIPAKTFLVGEYAAIVGGAAIIITTSPAFELSIAANDVLSIHPDSPAGKFWAHSGLAQSIQWLDPYNGKGGLGASSAEFLGAYLAHCHLTQQEPNIEALLNAYHHFSWNGEGLRPSGYDVIAQSQQQCVYINRQKNIIKQYEWSFSDISFLLVHSGQKLPTHHHLQKTKLPDAITEFSDAAEHAALAFEANNSDLLINAINSYHQLLCKHHLIAPHSLAQLNTLKLELPILAAKGCGALGADVLLLIIPTKELNTYTQTLTNKGWTILASNNNLYKEQVLIKNTNKRLEILV